MSDQQPEVTNEQLQAAAVNLNNEFSQAQRDYAAVDEGIRNGTISKSEGADMKLQLRDRGDVLQAQFGQVSGELQRRQAADIQEYARKRGLDAEGLHAEGRRLGQFLREQGYTDQEIAGIGMDPKSRKLALDAMKGSGRQPSPQDLKEMAALHRRTKRFTKPEDRYSQDISDKAPPGGGHPRNNSRRIATSHGPIEAHATKDEAAQMRGPGGVPLNARQMRQFRLFGKLPRD